MLPEKFGNKEYGLVLMTKDRRVVFMLPWINNIIFGTTEK